MFIRAQNVSINISEGKKRSRYSVRKHNMYIQVLPLSLHLTAFSIGTKKDSGSCKRDSHYVMKTWVGFLVTNGYNLRFPLHYQD